jgi:hypothetical protein
VDIDLQQVLRLRAQYVWELPKKSAKSELNNLKVNDPESPRVEVLDKYITRNRNFMRRFLAIFIIIALLGSAGLYWYATIPTQKFMIESSCVASYDLLVSKNQTDCVIYTSSSMRLCRSYCSGNENENAQLCVALNRIGATGNCQEDTNTAAWVMTIVSSLIAMLGFFVGLHFEVERRIARKESSKKLV